MCVRIVFLSVLARPRDCYYNTLLCCDKIFKRRVWYHTLSLCYVCIQILFHHPHLLGYFCAKFCYFGSLHCWASPWRKITYSITLTHPAYLMLWELKLVLWNLDVHICSWVLDYCLNILLFFLLSCTCTAAYIHLHLICSYYKPSTAEVTCEIKLFQNYFSLCWHPSKIILFQHTETCLKSFQNYFRGWISAYEYFPTCSMSLK